MRTSSGQADPGRCQLIHHPLPRIQCVTRIRVYIYRESTWFGCVVSKCWGRPSRKRATIFRTLILCRESACNEPPGLSQTKIGPRIAWHAPFRGGSLAGAGPNQRGCPSRGVASPSFRGPMGRAIPFHRGRALPGAARRYGPSGPTRTLDGGRGRDCKGQPGCSALPGQPCGSVSPTEQGVTHRKASLGGREPDGAPGQLGSEVEPSHGAHLQAVFGPGGKHCSRAVRLCLDWELSYRTPQGKAGYGSNGGSATVAQESGWPNAL